MSLGTGAEIFGHSLRVFRQHRQLAIYPLLTMAMGLALFTLLAPVAFHMSHAELWNSLWRPAGEQQTMQHIMDALSFNKLWELPLQWLLAAFLLGKLGITFINYAFCSQAINALNGGSISIARSIGLAANRVEVIVPWALLAGMLGVAIVVVMHYLGVFGLMLVAVIGTSVAMGRLSIMPSVMFWIPWNVASQFVIPVMLNEPRRLNPVAYLKISAQMIRRNCGDALVVGVVGPSVVGYWCAVGVGYTGMLIAYITDQFAFFSFGMLLGFAISCVSNAVNLVYLCGLYIYATEGVAPGAFDAELFERSWVVK